MAGGATGDALDGLLDLHQLVHNRIYIAGHTRVASAVLELESGKEYRFVPPGPTIQPAEWQACLDQLETADRQSVVLGKGVSVLGDCGGRRIIKKKKLNLTKSKTT